MLPSTFIALPSSEKAFLIAAIQMKQKQDEKEAKRLKSKSAKR